LWRAWRASKTIDWQLDQSRRVTLVGFAIAAFIGQPIGLKAEDAESARGEEDALAGVPGGVGGDASLGQLQQGQPPVGQSEGTAHAFEDSDAVVDDREVHHASGHSAAHDQVPAF
jgi:hypothetical protein